jgi:TIR domain-containing protein
MSDIFISYAKADHALAVKLSAFLESEGWTVWWDKSLGAADLYRNEIMKQLAAARAVITIWSENSIKSDWVRAEAGRAKADGKLIPVKTPELTYADIPLPFGEMHTENVSSLDLIRAAVVSQLAKPALIQTSFWQITGLFKYQLLTWIGIVGSSITLFANFNGVLDLADWARGLVTHWHELTQMFWGWVFGWIGLKVPKELVPVISFIVFAALLVVGVNLAAWIVPQAPETQDTTSAPRKMRIFVTGALLYFTAMYVFLFGSYSWLNIRGVKVEEAALWLVVVWSIVFPMSYLMFFIKWRALVLIASLSFVFMGGCLLYLPLTSLSSSEAAELKILSGFALLQICWMAVILFSPLPQLTRRLGFVVLGVLTLLALSEISKLNLHQYLQPPKVSDNSVR